MDKPNKKWIIIPPTNNAATWNFCSFFIFFWIVLDGFNDLFLFLFLQHHQHIVKFVF